MESIEHMDWPTRSLDLNPKIHMWNELQARISARQLQPRTIKDFGAMLVHEWTAMRSET
jgi:hypothetical protein